MMKGTSKGHRFRVRQNLVKDAQTLGVKPTARKWGMTPKTVRKWLHRYKKSGVRGLEDQRKGPKKIPHKTSKEIEKEILALRRKAPCYGPKRLKYFYDLPCSLGAIQRILQTHQLTDKRRKKYHKKNDLRAVKARYPSMSYLQMDVKHLYDIPYYWAQMKKYGLPKYQYTVRDVKSGMLFLGFSQELSELNARTMIGCVLERLKKSSPIPMEKVTVQTDNGAEFSGQCRSLNGSSFARYLEKELKVKHVYIPPGCCNANADVESVHNTIEKEFFGITTFSSKEDFFKKVEMYRLFYNLERPNFSKGARTPWLITHQDWKKSDLASCASLLQTVNLDKISYPFLGGYYLPVFAAVKPSV